ncbi:uncharacterized protein LOC127796172 isoform X2 [Diospyros lotus]|nr:uncharacterized protein LOC127796172 isoform X2 [Diospyros lotus]XP_052184140.1 uncharacterized protein LOC127796172 isoform X2 [Diospyros lotus]XP_052184141.1 uncharacterized protein LOC127796172 isoform X2 [Diospyros lotus]
MGDHFALLVDRLLTESTLEAAIESRNPGKRSAALGTEITKIDCSSHDIDIKDISSPRKMVECKICQDEDEVSNMETPCCCCGSLKYAHRRCVQRWCDEKGDTLCEICQQPFEPGYTAPPPMFQFGSVPMNFRGNWEIARRDVNNTRFIAMVSTDRNFLDPDNDEYTVSASRNLFHCRSVAIIFMVLLILRHVLPIVIDGTQDLSLPLLLLLALRTCGVVLPIYIVARAVNAIHCRQRQQQQQRHQGSGSGNISSSDTSSSSSDEESGLLPTPHHRHHYHHPQFISIH